jgi:hypothetical protein
MRIDRPGRVIIDDDRIAFSVAANRNGVLTSSSLDDHSHAL